MERLTQSILVTPFLMTIIIHAAPATANKITQAKEPGVLSDIPLWMAQNSPAEIRQELEQLRDPSQRNRLLELQQQFEQLQEAPQANSVADLQQQVEQLYHQGNYAAAIPLEQELLSIKEHTFGPEHPEVADSLNNLGALYSSQGNYVAALPFYERALAIREKALGSDHPNVALSLNNLGILYRNQGNDAAALPLYQRALAIREKALGGDHPDVAHSLNNLAALYYNQGNYGAALPLYQRALAIREKALGSDHPDVAHSLNNLGVLYRDQGNYGAALPLYQRALTIWQAALGENHPNLATSLNNLAMLYRDQGNYGQALPLYQRALTIREKALGANHPDVALSLNNLGSLFWATTDLPQALQSLRRGLEIEEVNLSHNLVVGSEEYKRNYLSTFDQSTHRAISFHLQGNTNNPAAADLALTTILRRKGRLLDVLGETTNRFRNQLDASGQRQFEQLVALRTQIAGLTFAQDTPTNPNQIAQLHQQANALEGQLSTQSAAFRQATTPVTIAEVQKAIPGNAALVEFVQYRPFNPKVAENQALGAPRYAVYVLRSTGSPQWIDLGDARTIDALIQTTQRQFADPRLPAAQIKGPAQALEAKIMMPVRQLAGNATHLLIAPDAQLNVIPFTALVDGQGRYLLESYTITTLTSGRDLLHLQVPSPRPNHSLVVADPTFDRAAPSRFLVASSRGTSQRSGDLRNLAFNPLPGTAAEANAIRELLPQADVLTQAQATEAAVKAANRPRILHLATHGFFLENNEQDVGGDRRGGHNPMAVAAENPLLRSGLALAGFNQRQSGGDDGVLTALEVTGIDLHGTELVVMSACDTGRGDVVNGDGVYGLRRAFTLAGARSQVSTLWKVDDGVTKRMMVAYYQNLLQGMGRTEAMRQVQLEMLKDSSYQTPYYWAAFVASGDWLPLP